MGDLPQEGRRRILEQAIVNALSVRQSFQRPNLLLPRWGCRSFTSACPDYDRCNAILRGRACVRQIAVLTIQLIGHIAASSADPAVVEPVNDQGGAIRERETFRCFINPEIHGLFGARRSDATRRIYDDYFFVGQFR
jgi:hypothetical protein